MKKFYSTVVLALLSFLLVAQSGWRKDEMEIKVNLSSQQIARALNELRLNGDYYPDHAILYVTPSEIKELENKGVVYDIRIRDLNRHYQGFWDQRDGYHTYSQIIYIMDSLANVYPDICKIYEYGYSYGNRKLRALKISDNVSVDENEAEVMFDGGIHGDEIGCSENLIRFARQLCYGFGADSTITNLINQREIWLYIMVNPDGRENMTRHNNNGVDLNRDWGYMWDGWGNSPSAYSQKESKALRSCMMNNQFVIHTAYHSGIEYISYPWSYRADECPDKEHFDFLAELYSDTSGYAYLPFGQGNTGMYDINGSTKDGNYGSMGSVTWSMEISYNKQPPASQIMTYYNYNLPSMLAMIEYTGYGIQGMITDAETGEAVPAIIRVDDFFPIYSDPLVGDYHKYLGPGTYDITVIANGYESKTIEGIQIENHTDIVEQNIALQPAYGNYIYKFISSRIPNNNPYDEGYTPAVFGEPDQLNYSIGGWGWAVFDMLDSIKIGAVPEITVYEGDDSPEGFSLYYSNTMDGPWTLIGEGDGTTYFNLPDTTPADIRYLKIVDDGNGPFWADNAGFDLDAILLADPEDAVALELGRISIVDSITGNGNGIIDPGETIEIEIPLMNLRPHHAKYTYGLLNPLSGEMTIETDSIYYGNIDPKGSITQKYTITVDGDQAEGETINLELKAHSYGNTYVFSFEMELLVGQTAVLIADLSMDQKSGPELENCCIDMDMSYYHVNELSYSHKNYDYIFICLGSADSARQLTQYETQWITDCLDDEGSIYLEGGKVWAENPDSIGSRYFRIEGTDSTYLSTGFEGVEGTFTHDMLFGYSYNETPVHQLWVLGKSAFAIMQNTSSEHFAAIAFDSVAYRTIGSAFEFGGLEEGLAPSTKTDYFSRIIDFFDGLYTTVKAPTTQSDKIWLRSGPNPFNMSGNISFYLDLETNVDLTIYNQKGIPVRKLYSGKLTKGIHEFPWDGSNHSGNKLPDGIYLCRLTAGNSFRTIGIIINSN